MENRLAVLRERRGLSQQELASALDVSKQTVVAIEKGKYDPSLPLAKALARFFRVAVEDVFPAAADAAALTKATFVMTDIARSTELVQQLGEHYVELLRRHRELLIDVFTTHGGRVVDDTGDACFAVFDDAGQALTAALAAQRAVTSESWPNGVALKIRIGIHTGEAYAVGNRFVGLAVHEASRVCEAAQGGQILVSEATATTQPETRLTETGSHNLQGVGERRLYVVGDDA